MKLALEVASWKVFALGLGVHARNLSFPPVDVILACGLNVVPPLLLFDLRRFWNGCILVSGILVSDASDYVFTRLMLSVCGDYDFNSIITIQLPSMQRLWVIRS